MPPDRRVARRLLHSHCGQPEEAVREETERKTERERNERMERVPSTFHFRFSLSSRSSVEAVLLLRVRDQHVRVSGHEDGLGKG